MLGFAGLPLTGGFFAKFYAFAAAYETGWWWLMLVGVAATVVSLYYYLAVIRALYMRSPVELQFAAAGGSPPRELMLSSAVLGTLAVTVGTFFFVQPVIDWAQDAAGVPPALAVRARQPGSVPGTERRAGERVNFVTSYERAGSG